MKERGHQVITSEPFDKNYETVQVTPEKAITMNLEFVFMN